MTTALSLGWGVVVGLLVTRAEPRIVVRRRARGLGGAMPKSRRFRSLGIVGRVAGDIATRRQQRRRAAQVVDQLPIVTDLIAVAIGAGFTPSLAFDRAARHCPAEVAVVMRRVTEAQLLGESFSVALARLGDHPRELARLRAVLSDAAQGAPALGALDQLATEQRAALRRAGETRARTVPVRLLFPLVFLVLPAFGLITVVPAVEAGLRGL